MPFPHPLLKEKKKTWHQTTTDVMQSVVFSFKLLKILTNGKEPSQNRTSLILNQKGCR